MNIRIFLNEPAIQRTLSYCRLKLEHLKSHIDRLCDKPNSSEISITFKPKWRDLYDNLEMKNYIYNYFESMVKQLDIYYVVLVPEYGSNKNLHYHGLIGGSAETLSQLKIFMNRRFGRCYIRSIKYVESYKKYLVKEQTSQTDAFVIRSQDPDTIIL